MILFIAVFALTVLLTSVVAFAFIRRRTWPALRKKRVFAFICALLCFPALIPAAISAALPVPHILFIIFTLAEPAAILRFYQSFGVYTLISFALTYLFFIAIAQMLFFVPPAPRAADAAAVKKDA